MLMVYMREAVMCTALVAHVTVITHISRQVYLGIVIEKQFNTLESIEET